MSLPNRSLKRLLSTTSITQNTIQTRPTPCKSHLFHPPTASSLPKGYIVGATHCGIKKTPANSSAPPKLDLGLVLSTSPYPTTCAASFTRNAFRAAPVLVSDEVLRKRGGYARGLVVNSGCANAVTGAKGMEDAWTMVREAGTVGKNEEVQKDGHEDVLVMSTGVIGVNLPISKIVNGIRSFNSSTSSSADASLCNTPNAWTAFAKSFMTTDTFPKLLTRTFSIGGRDYRMAGIDKGAGMIHPDMGPASTSFSSSSARPLHATLLGCIMTDAAITPSSLQNALNYAIDRSFNSISVDGDMSTNDTVVLLANGAAHAPSSLDSSLASSSTGFRKDAPTPIDEGTDKEAYLVFRDELTSFAQELAQLVVRDGEGATKFVQVTVKGAPTYKAAHAIASKISTSALVKTALYGEDANWGRILAATGSVPLASSPPSSNGPLAIDPTKVSVTFIPCASLQNQAPLPVLMNGEPHPFSEDRAKEILQEEDFEVVVDLGIGAEEARFWTCDLSYEYVRINGDYRS